MSNFTGHVVADVRFCLDVMPALVDHDVDLGSECVHKRGAIPAARVKRHTSELAGDVVRLSGGKFDGALDKSRDKTFDCVISQALAAAAPVILLRESEREADGVFKKNPAKSMVIVTG